MSLTSPLLSFCRRAALAAACAAAGWTHGQTIFDPRLAAESLRPAGGRAPVDDWGLPSEARSQPAVGLAEPSPGDDDLGDQAILYREPRLRPWTTQLGGSFLWTDNAANAPDTGARMDDWFWQQSLQITYQRPLSERWIPYVSLGEQAVRYQKLSELDFEQVEGKIGAGYVLPEAGDSLLHAEVGWQRYTQGITEEPIYENFSLECGWDAARAFTHQWSLHYGLAARFSLAAEPDILQRHDYDAHFMLQWRILPELVCIAAGRVAYFDFQNLGGRQDWNANGSLALTWKPRPWLDVSVSWGFAQNESNLAAFSYRSSLAGPAIAARLTF